MCSCSMAGKSSTRREQVSMSEVLDRMISEGYNKGISIGEARGRSEAKKEYEEELALLRAKLAKYEAQELSN